MKRMALAALAALSLSGCLKSLPPQSFAGTSPEMRPEIFFAGDTSSYGVLETGSGRPSRIFRVEGHGAAQPDGAFRLDQTIRWADGKVDRRTWMMRRLDAHRYTATLSDAAGPVTAEAYGNVFHLRYRLKGPAHMEQWIYLQPGGQEVLNVGTVSVLGSTVARLSERISRAG